jgi:hypothetical protein
MRLCDYLEVSASRFPERLAVVDQVGAAVTTWSSTSRPNCRVISGQGNRSWGPGGRSAGDHFQRYSKVRPRSRPRRTWTTAGRRSPALRFSYTRTSPKYRPDLWIGNRPSSAKS